MNRWTLNEVSSPPCISWGAGESGSHDRNHLAILASRDSGQFFLEEGGLPGTQTWNSSTLPSSLVSKVKLSKQLCTKNFLFACLVWVLSYFWPMYSQLSSFHMTVIRRAPQILRISWTFMWGMSFHVPFIPITHQVCSAVVTMVGSWFSSFNFPCRLPSGSNVSEQWNGQKVVEWRPEPGC